MACRVVIKQTVASGQSMGAELSLEVSDASGIGDAVPCRGQKFEPDRILLQPAQTEHPLKGYRKIAAPFAIFRRKPAPEENCHTGSIGGKSS